ncbi:MAG: type II toxin-antitoxin system VapC family toxin [Planctomycetes bacterium]|nr:type II toxin-antitoxin system VapC family toxin [Planctomycetota bacterium]
MARVLDASAVLAFLLGEKGADAALAAMPGSQISTVNIVEVFSRMVDYGSPDEDVRQSIRELALETVNFDEDLAVRSGALRRETASLGLSVGDRACLATAMKLGATVVTADRAWLKLKLGVTIECIR